VKLLEGKAALISGAGRGIGRATAILFAEQGADLILLARTESQLADTAAACRRHGVDVFHRQVDLSEFSEIANLFAQLPETFATIDILINNAAMFGKGLMAEYPLAEFRKMMDVNVIAPFYLSQLALARMPAGGAVVNISSFSGCFDAEKFPGFGAYDISKYGLWGLTEMLAIELRERDIRVNQISPSGVDTEMFRQAVPPGVSADLTPEDVAAAILELVTDQNLTGQNLKLAERLAGHNPDD
jgi:3-oxoacyl-[acyl-carrier protein] reductase